MRNMEKYGHRAAILLVVPVVAGSILMTTFATLTSEPDENYAIAEPPTPGITKDISPEFAYPVDKWTSLRDNVMEHDELANLIHEYDPMVCSNRSALSDQKKQNLTDINEQLLDDTRDLWDDASSTDMDPHNDGIQVAQPGFAGNSLTKMTDQNYMGTDMYKITCNQTEANLVFQTQQLTAAYEQLAYTVENLNASGALAQASYKATVARKNAGMATRTDVLTALKSVRDIDTSILSAQKSADNAHRNPYMMLGQGADSQLEIRPISAPDLDRIAVMNPEADREQTAVSNYDVRYNERKIQSLRSEGLIASTDATLEDVRSKVYNSLKIWYNTTPDTGDALDTVDIKFQSEAVGINTASAKTATENISSLELVQQQNAYTSVRSDAETGKMQLMPAMGKYDWVKEGLTF